MAWKEDLPFRRDPEEQLMAGSPSFPSRVRASTSWEGVLCPVNTGHEQWVHVVNTLHKISTPAKAGKARTVDNLQEHGSHRPPPSFLLGRICISIITWKCQVIYHSSKPSLPHLGCWGNLLKNWLWLFPNSKGDDVVLFILGNGCGW